MAERVSVGTPAVYRVRVRGRVPLGWSTRMMGMNITASGEGEAEVTTLVGRLPDQAALSGLLSALFETSFVLLSVECLEVG
ncbi:MAG: hypothetical protein V2J02_10635 [Pseudomonadales bacterium]|jgi:hypothetical protein|nr:hypothetical protein [Pseudomonadales bacterium]